MTFQIYDVLSDTWTSGPELQYARRNLSTAQLKGRVYAVGGYDSQELLASVEALDPRMRSWTEVNSAFMLVPHFVAVRADAFLSLVSVVLRGRRQYLVRHGRH